MPMIFVGTLHECVEFARGVQLPGLPWPAAAAAAVAEVAAPVPQTDEELKPEKGDADRAPSERRQLCRHSSEPEREPGGDDQAG